MWRAAGGGSFPGYSSHAQAAFPGDPSAGSKAPLAAAGREGLTKRVSAVRHRRSDLAPDSLRELGQPAFASVSQSA